MNPRKLVIGITVLLICGIALEQWFSYQELRKNVGKHAYTTVGYALRMVGRKGEYVGRIIDCKWNSLPASPEDIQGFQPRYLIERQVRPDQMECRWFCTYLFDVRDQPPKKYRPSQFPQFQEIPREN
ncbi:MAG: hypothetical protein ACOX5R_02835 [bacterium]|jgi:hypothetical protein